MYFKPCCCEYIAERNLALVNLFRDLVKANPLFDIDAICGEITRAPAPRFFISEDRALLVISLYMQCGVWPGKSRLRHRLYADLLERVRSLLAAGDADDLEDAVYMAVQQPAPSFYLTQQTIRTNIFRTLRKNRDRLQQSSKKGGWHV